MTPLCTVFILFVSCWLDYKHMKVLGYDPFQGIGAGTFCVHPRPVNCCNKTLMESYTPKAKGGHDPPDTKFFLYTLQNPEFPEFLHDCYGRLPTNSKFNPARQTEIFVHGWLDGVCRTAWMREMRNELFMRGKGEYNVILVDWTWGNTPDYFVAASNTKVVGEQLAFVINNIIADTQSSGDMFHIIGHSFGCHIAGFAGQNIPDLRRITALDPAANPFRGQSTENKLSKNDARLIDVIHTSDTECSVTGFGHPDPIGNADFYPNGGKNQNQNLMEIATSFLKLNVLYGGFLLLPQFYNHLMAIQYYKSSINPCGCQFVGVKCRDYTRFQQHRCNFCSTNGTHCSVMGMDFELYYHKEDNRYHKYYLNTDPTCPYCNNERLLLNGFVGRNGGSCRNIENLSGMF